jgi:hypothetical protein
MIFVEETQASASFSDFCTFLDTYSTTCVHESELPAFLTTKATGISPASSSSALSIQPENSRRH